MKPFVSQFARLTSAVAAGLICSGPLLFAADEATPPPPTQNQRDDTARGNRGNAGGRGNFGGGGGNFAGGGGNFGGRGGFGGLNLDDKQNELLREAMQAENDELRKLSEKLQAAQKELVKVVIAEKYDEKAIREKAEAISKIQTEITVLRAKAFATLSPTLKPEQRDALENSRIASSIITGAGIGFGGAGGGGPQQDQTMRRNDRGNNDRGNPGDANQFRRRGGDRQAGPGQ
jgi:Spy/CpxP family protein refolding chaperone